MAHINIDRRVMDNINGDDIRKSLNHMIEAELSKNSENINTAFVDECVNALLELEQGENDLPLIHPLMSGEQYLKMITRKNTAKGFRSLNTFARVAVVAAIVAGGTMTANAAVEAVTGVNVIKRVADSVENTLVDWGVIQGPPIENVDAGWLDEEEETTQKTTTEPVTEPTTVKKPAPIENIDAGWDDEDDESTTKKPAPIENIDAGWGDEEDETTTKKPAPIENIDAGWGDDEDDTTEPQKPTRPSTTQQTTDRPAIEQTTKPGEAAVFTQLRADYGDSFKFDYIYGEKLSYEGLKLIAGYSDGTEKEIALDECKYTKSIDTTVTADYTLSILYKSSTIQIHITVRPDEFTRGSEICSNKEYDYLFTSDGAYITAYKGYSDFITLDEVDGNKVIAIGPSCFKDKGVQTVTAQNVTRIYGNAFEGCKNLTDCHTPFAEYIGDYAFSECELLNRAVYSDKLAYIGKGVYNKTAIEEIVIPSGVTEIPDYAFNECENLTSVKMLGEVTYVGAYAFNDCKKLEAVSGTAGIKEVGAFAFADDELVNFDAFPQRLEKAGESAFYFCQKLEIGDLPGTMKELNANAFAYCPGLTEIKIPEGITVIPENCFRATNAKTILLPEGVEEIDKYAFMSHKAKQIVLPRSLRVIRTYGLYSVMLRTVYFDTGIEEIGADAFYAGRSVTFHVYRDSVPMYYAAANDIKYQLRDETAEIGEEL